MKIIRTICIMFALTFQIEAQFILDWEQTYDGGRNDSGESIYLDSDGNVIVAGTAFGEDFMPDATIIKYTANGEFLWSQSYNIGGEDKPIGVYFDSEVV